MNCGLFNMYHLKDMNIPEWALANGYKVWFGHDGHGNHFSGDAICPECGDKDFVVWMGHNNEVTCSKCKTYRKWQAIDIFCNYTHTRYVKFQKFPNTCETCAHKAEEPNRIYYNNYCSDCDTFQRYVKEDTKKVN